MEIAQAFQVILMIYVGLAWAQSWVLKLKSLGLCWAATWELGVTEAPSRTRFIALSTIFIEIFPETWKGGGRGKFQKFAKNGFHWKQLVRRKKSCTKKAAEPFLKYFHISRWILILNNFIGSDTPKGVDGGTNGNKGLFSKPAWIFDVCQLLNSWTELTQENQRK